MKLAVNDIGGIFGTIAPPTSLGAGDPVTALSNLFSFGLQLVLVIGALSLLVYLLWGAMDWLFSNGEKEKLAKAQNKIMNAIIGMLLIIIVFTLFTVITGTILGNKIIENTNGGWRLIIPTIAP